MTLDNTWIKAQDKAKKAGQLLGEVLEKRVQGERPVVLVRPTHLSRNKLIGTRSDLPSAPLRFFMLCFTSPHCRHFLLPEERSQHMSNLSTSSPSLPHLMRTNGQNAAPSLLGDS